MSCVHPIPALDLGYKINGDGKRVRNIKLLDMKHKFYGFGLEELKERFKDDLVLLPCGHCYMCSIDYSRMWASRIMLEAKDHVHNCFLTLTFNDWCLPERPSKRHIQLFIKRLRKQVQVPIRYYACGEVGEGKGSRGYNPHYHLIIFGYDFPDKVEFKRSESGLMIYRSEELDKLWSIKDKNGNLFNLGYASIGDVTPESAQYVAKYSMKKHLTGEDCGEFTLMSRRPGIGAKHYDEIDWNTYKIYESGKQFKVPRFYEKMADQKKDVFQLIGKEKRMEIGKFIKSKKFQWNLTREEEALVKANNERIINDCLKRRYV